MAIPGNYISKRKNKTGSSGPKLMSVPNNCDSQGDNAMSSVLGNVNPCGKLNRVRYPGDIHDMATMSRKQLESCVRICKSKVEQQATTIKSLRRKVKMKDERIETLRSLVKEIKQKFALSEHAAESIEVSIKSVKFCQ